MGLQPKKRSGWLLTLFAEASLKRLVVYLLVVLLGVGSAAYLGRDELGLARMAGRMMDLPPVRWRVSDGLFGLAILATLALVAFFAGQLVLYRAYVKGKFRGYDFVSHEDLLWKYQAATGSVDKRPYCPHHKIELNELHVAGLGGHEGVVEYRCDLSHQHSWQMYEHIAAETYEAACRIVNAKIAGHLQR